ncbi:seven-hairpin glycosidase [Auriculariales sp. MPI-PUGE-AT-0066]|nr:seven-hairpin glycosidase [Auriculariales sp. MPI-PUGE-AT-0066]
MLPTPSSSTPRKRLPWATTSNSSWGRRRPRILLVVFLAILVLLYMIRSRAFFAPGPRAPEDWTSEMEAQYGKRPAAPDVKKKSQPIITVKDRKLWASRAEQVKAAFLYAYHGYEQYATWPEDELKPTSNIGERNFNAWGVTVVDSISTMVLMDTKPELERAIALVAKMDFKQTSNSHVPFFETVIRYLGGLLSGYALTNNTVFLSRAEDLGHRLLPIFNTPSGIPGYSVDTEKGTTKDAGDRVGRSLIAEIASCQVEYKYLAHLTGRKEFFQKADAVMDIMEKSQKSNDNNLWQLHWTTDNAQQVGKHYSVAAEADSAYEYLLKQYLLSGKTEKRMLKMYLDAVDGVIKELLFLSPTRKMLYISDIEVSRFTGKFEHLGCFFPGLLALGVETLSPTELPDDVRQMHLWVAEGLAHSCYLMYADQASGLAPELAVMQGWPDDWRKGKWLPHVEEWRRIGSPGGKPPGVGNLAAPWKSGTRDYDIRVNSYLSRPETMESQYIMWRVTGDPRWRENGWKMWQAIEAKTKTDSGFSSVWGVDSSNPTHMNSQPSYFLAETVKYAYLICIDPSEDPWSKGWVFNTEAHPLPVFQWSPWEKDYFKVPM